MSANPTAAPLRRPGVDRNPSEVWPPVVSDSRNGNNRAEQDWDKPPVAPGQCIEKGSKG